jgi:hypothetical protein
MTQVQNNTSSKNANRNERRRAARKAKASQFKTTPIEKIEGTIEGVEVNKINNDGTAEITGTIDSSALQIEGTVNKEVKVESDRGVTTKLIWDMMSRPEGCTREEVLTALKERFPNKKDAALKNTMGALMHVLPIRYEHDVVKTQIDAKDKRKVRFQVKKIHKDVEETKAA